MTALMLLGALAHAETTVSVDNLSVDGLQVRALHCTLDRGGLLASAMVVGALAAEKATIDTCGAPGAALTIRWTWGADTTVTHVDDQPVTSDRLLLFPDESEQATSTTRSSSNHSGCSVKYSGSR